MGLNLCQAFLRLDSNCVEIFCDLYCICMSNLNSMKQQPGGVSCQNFPRKKVVVQVILFEIDCAIFLHKFKWIVISYISFDYLLGRSNVWPCPLFSSTQLATIYIPTISQDIYVLFSNHNIISIFFDNLLGGSNVWPCPLFYSIV